MNDMEEMWKEFENFRIKDVVIMTMTISSIVQLQKRRFLFAWNGSLLNVVMIKIGRVSSNLRSNVIF